MNEISKDELDEKRQLVLQGQLSKYMERNTSLIPRYLVLNYYGLFIYKDEIKF